MLQSKNNLQSSLSLRLMFSLCQHMFILGPSSTIIRPTRRICMFLPCSWKYFLTFTIHYTNFNTYPFSSPALSSYLSLSQTGASRMTTAWTGTGRPRRPSRCPKSPRSLQSLQPPVGPAPPAPSWVRPLTATHTQTHASP